MTKRWATLRILLAAHWLVVLFAFLVLFVGTMAVTFVTSAWWDVDRSIWHYVASQWTQWVVIGLGTDVISTYLRLHIAHGRTRRDFLRQLWPYFVGVAGLYGVFVAIGYLVERGVYGIMGWRQSFLDTGVFDTAGDFFGLAGAFAVTFLLWLLGGTLLAAAFNRNVLLGLLLVPFGLLLASLGELLVGRSVIPLFHVAQLLRVDGLSKVAIGVALLAAGCVLLWGIVRDIPVRVKVA
jgi:hypothetical protein